MLSQIFKRSRIITEEEFQKNSDKWVTYNRKVYDISEFISLHPGGSVIENYLGKDVTEAIEVGHPRHVRDQMKKWYIGDYKK